jgi:hypothetical protein
MIAYRTRVLSLIAATSNALRSRGLRLPAPVPLARPVKLGLILPPLVVESAAARPPLLAPSAAAGLAAAPQVQLPAAPPLPVLEAEAAPVPGDGSVSSSPSGTVSVAGAPAKPGAAASPARAPRPRKSPLAFLPGGRLREELVPLVIRVRGRGLDLAKHVGLQAFGEAFVPVELSRATAEPEPAGGAAAAQGPPSRWVQLSSLQHALRQRVKSAAAAVSQAARGVPPVWRAPAGAMGDLTLRVLLPRSVVARLVSPELSPPPRPPSRAGQGAGGAAPPAAAAPPLLLQLRSDMQAVSIPVRLDPRVIGVLGGTTSQPAADLVAALLSSQPALPESPQAPAAASGAAAAPAAAGTPRFPLLRWVPLPAVWQRGGAAAAQQQAAALAAAQEPSPHDLEMRRRAERRKRRRALAEAAAASSGEGWVEPWVAPGAAKAPAPTAAAAAAAASPAGTKSSAQGTAARRPSPAPAPAAPTHSAAGRTAQPERGRPGGAKDQRQLPAPVGGGRAGGGGSSASPRPALGLRGGQTVGRQLPPAGSNAAAAAPVAVAGSAARRRGRTEGLSPSRLPAVAATVDEIELAGDEATRAAGAGSRLTALISRAQGLMAPFVGGGAPAAAAPAPAPAPRLQAPLQLAAPQPVPSPQLPALPPTRFVLLPSPGATDDDAAGPLAAGAPLWQQWPQPSPLRGVDAIALVTDVDSVLLNGGACLAPLLAAAAAAGRPVVALLVQPAPAAPRALVDEARRALVERLGGGVSVVELDVAGVDLRLAAQQPDAPAVELWAPALAALPPARRARLAGQVAEARAALRGALQRGGDAGAAAGWALAPAERSRM